MVFIISYAGFSLGDIVVQRLLTELSQGWCATLAQQPGNIRVIKTIAVIPPKRMNMWFLQGNTTATFYRCLIVSFSPRCCTTGSLQHLRYGLAIKLNNSCVAILPSENPALCVGALGASVSVNLFNNRYLRLVNAASSLFLRGKIFVSYLRCALATVEEWLSEINLDNKKVVYRLCIVWMPPRCVVFIYLYFI